WNGPPTPPGHRGSACRRGRAAPERRRTTSGNRTGRRTRPAGRTRPDRAGRSSGRSSSWSPNGRGSGSGPCRTGASPRDIECTSRSKSRPSCRHRRANRSPVARVASEGRARAIIGPEEALSMCPPDRRTHHGKDYAARRGWERAVAIKERLSKIKVPVVIAGVAKDMTIQEIDSVTSVHLTFSDIVREAMNVDKLDLEYLEGIDERRKRAMDERVKRLEDYTRAAMTAWKDGRVTATERLLVEQLRENLGISREEQERIESEVLEEVIENRAGIYRAVAAQALEDGPATEDVRELLEALRKKLGLSSHDCREIEAALTKNAA